MHSRPSTPVATYIPLTPPPTEHRLVKYTLNNQDSSSATSGRSETSGLTSDKIVLRLDGDSNDDEIVGIGKTSMPTTKIYEQHLGGGYIANLCVGNNRITSDGDLELDHIDLGTSDGKRQRSEEVDHDDSDIELVGVMRSKKTKRIGQLNSQSTSATGGTPLRALDRDMEPICTTCGCDCKAQADWSATSGRRAGGSGSSTLSLAVRSNILELLLRPGESLFTRMRSEGLVNDWKDIAAMVGAQREDFDRVRHCARSLQDSLPGRMRRGEL
ncbi:hypothetical protein IAR55_002089 [Kwoniella newhampshirensis]|uniref:Myb-like domain-containing protein n=1 Tax=Kwoniella newhampshirensis TaxID=1651941 RepID=A0AAW0Z0L7_9TREE